MKKKIYEVVMKNGETFQVDKRGISLDYPKIRYKFILCDRQFNYDEVNLGKIKDRLEHSVLVYKVYVESEYSRTLYGMGSTKYIKKVQ